MTKTEQQRNSSGYQPFTYTMEQWDDKANCNSGCNGYF